MINDIRLAKQKEQSLDDWINDYIAVVNDVIYEIVIEITQVLYGVLRRVR